MIEQIIAKIDALTLWDIAWFAVGALGSLLFFLRWPIQAFYAYRLKRSQLPRAFWYISLFGALCLTSYALIYLKDIIFTFVNACGMAIYLLNLSMKEEGEKRPPRRHMHGLRE